MTEIRLYNTATRQKEALRPVRAGEVSVYVCGPTVYDRAHLGNGRSAVAFDVLYRLLRHAFGPEHVRFVRNFTDVDDRINETARARRAAGAAGTLEDLIRERSDETIRWYQEDMAALGCLAPTDAPRATEYIAQMIAMIEGLIAGGHAYAAEGHVLFAVESYADYGRLSGRSVEDMIAGARVEVAPYKRNPMDFVLWKPSDDDLPGWQSPWGRGRPGWHIECSAMTLALLGETFDIHGGGSDLVFPHHENEIAQSRCAGHDFARIWMHNEMLQVEGKKMSKSLGNFFTVHDLLEQGVPGEVIRFVLLSTHYRKPMDWTETKRNERQKELGHWYRLVDGVSPGRLSERVLEPLRDDLNTHGAFEAMRHMASRLEASALRAAMDFFGFPAAEEVDWFRSQPTTISLGGSLDSVHLGDASVALSEVLKTWQELRNSKQYKQADQLKEELGKRGVVLRATGFGPEATVTADDNGEAARIWFETEYLTEEQGRD